MHSALTPFGKEHRPLPAMGLADPGPPVPGRPLTQHEQLVVQPVLAHLVGGLARVRPGILCTHQGDLQDLTSCRDTGPRPKQGQGGPLLALEGPWETSLAHLLGDMEMISLSRLLGARPWARRFPDLQLCV